MFTSIYALQRLGAFPLICLLIATSVAVEADKREKGGEGNPPAGDKHDAADRVLFGREVGWSETEDASGETAAVGESAPQAAAESVETAVVMSRARAEKEGDLEEGELGPIPVTSYEYHTAIKPDPDVAAELRSYITSTPPAPTHDDATGNRRRKRKKMGGGKLREVAAAAQRRAHLDERTFSHLGSLFVGKNSRPPSGSSGGGNYNQQFSHSTTRPQQPPDEVYGSAQSSFPDNSYLDSAQVAPNTYGSSHPPASFRDNQDSYGAPQGAVYQDQFQQGPDSYGSPQSPIHQSSDSYGAPLGGVVTHQANDGYGAPQGQVIHGGGAHEHQPPSSGYDAPQDDDGYRPPARRPNSRRPGQAIMGYLRGAMRGARDSFNSMGDSVLGSMRRLANRLRSIGGRGGGSGKRPEQGNQDYQQTPQKPRPPRLQLPQLELPKLPQLNIPTQLPPLKLPQIRLPQIKLPRPQLPQLPQVKLPRPQFPDIKLPRPLTHIQLPRPLFPLPSLRPGGGGYPHSQQESQGGYPQPQPTCGTSPAPSQYGSSPPKPTGDGDRYKVAAAAAAEAFDAGYGGRNPFLRSERNTVDSRERDMRRLRETWLQYRGAVLAYEQKYNFDDPALVRFKKEVLSSQALGFSAAGLPFETVGIPKLVEEDGERGFARAQEKRDSAISAPRLNLVGGAQHFSKGDVGLLGPGYSFKLYPREAQYQREREAATSRNDTPVPRVDVRSREEDEADFHDSAAAASDPFDLAPSPEDGSKLRKYEKILTPLLYGGNSVVKRLGRGREPVSGSNGNANGEESAKSEADKTLPKAIDASSLI